jgi:serine/threonine protein kinase
VSEERLVADRYRLVTRIGSGGMGVVWQAYDERLHRKVAVKQLSMPAELTTPQTEEATRLAMREGRIAAKLSHPNVIAVYDVIEEDGRPFLIMEYLPSTSLAQVLTERGPLPPDQVARIGSQVATALAAAHATGVIHRDIKPGNILLDKDGVAKITDFGISRAVEDVTATATGLIAGTPAYLSPEVAKGLPAMYQSDVYSLGATLYAAIEGVPPAGSTDNAMAMLYRVAHGELTPPSRAGAMTGLLTEMLHLDPARRPTMAEVTARLDNPPAPTRDRGHSETIRDRTPPALSAGRPEPGRRRRMVLLAGAALVLLILAAAVLYLTTQQPGAGTATPGPVSTSPQTTSTQPARPPVNPPATTTSAPAATTTVATQPPAGGQESVPDTIVAYYALLPGNLQQGWTRLTPKYQRDPAGGYGGYQTFWDRIRAVRVSDVRALPGNRAEATVEYSFKDGRIVLERHRYTLISQDNRWMIDESTVLSSQTR